MANDYNETEIKLLVSDLGAVEARLKALGSRQKAERVLERNWRYEDHDGRLAREGLVLRLRQDTRARLTYKEEAEGVSSGGTSRFEAETEVADFDAMHTILERLGYHIAFIYEKYRTTYTWEDAEIVLDETPIGQFVEIEADDAVIGGLLERLELRGAPVMGGSYSELFHRVRRVMTLGFRDMTFENFTGITVPGQALTDDELPYNRSEFA